MHLPRRSQTISEMVGRTMVERRQFHIPSRERTDTLELPNHEDGGIDPALLPGTGDVGSHKC